MAGGLVRLAGLGKNKDEATRTLLFDLRACLPPGPSHCRRRWRNSRRRRDGEARARDPFARRSEDHGRNRGTVVLRQGAHRDRRGSGGAWRDYLWNADSVREHGGANTSVSRTELAVCGLKASSSAKLAASLRAPQPSMAARNSTILGFHTTLLHHGMVIARLPYAFQGQTRTDEITGGSPYGASTIAGGKGERVASQNELAAARFQGQHVAMIARKLSV